MEPLYKTSTSFRSRTGEALGTTAGYVILLGLACANLAWADESTSVRMVEEDPRPVKRPLSGKWNLEIAGISEEEGQDQSLTSRLRLSSKLEYRFTSWMNLKFEPFLDFYSSREQTRFDDDYRDSALRIRNGYLNLHHEADLGYAALHLGAIGQAFLESPMLVSYQRAFPGAREIIGRKGELSSEQTYEVALVGQQLVPTSQSLNTERQEKEKTPGYETQSLHVKTEYKDWAKAEAIGGHYQWTNLPSRIAFTSGGRGNTVDGELAPGSHFQYEYEGYFWQTAGAFGPNKVVQGMAGYEGMINNQAPEDSRDARAWGLGARTWYKQVQLDIWYWKYFVESDASVAHYMYSPMGFTNRDGDSVKIELDFQELNFKVFGEWFGAQPINEDPNQFTYNSFYFGVETHYADF